MHRFPKRRRSGRYSFRGLAALGILLLPACGPRSAQQASQAAPTPGVLEAPAHYVPWLPLPDARLYVGPPEPSGTPGPPIPLPPGTPACHASQLEVTSLSRGAATGNVNMPVLLRNRSTTVCYLDGYADIHLLDQSGRILAEAIGSANRGTFFDQWPQVPVLMEVGTPAVPAATGPDQQVSRGQATMNMSWYDCRHPQASQLAIDLPYAGGRLLVSFTFEGAYYPACDSPGNKPLISLSRGPLSPAAFSWPPPPTYINVAISISAPATVQRGSTLVYYVTVANTSQTDYRLDPCPDYNEFLAAKAAFASFQLNCRPVGHIAPGVRVTFEMRLVVPPALDTGPNVVTWALGDGRLATPYARTSIEITN